jgi:ComF family protein
MSHTAMRLLSRSASALADLAYPRDCMACSAPAGTRYDWFCDECAAKLPLTSAENCCPACGLPFEGVVSTPRRCADCEEVAARWDRGATLLRYDGPAEALVKGLKYEGYRTLLSDVRKMVEKRPDVLELIRGSILVPVPLFPSRQSERGFNQSEWLADLFAECAGASRRNLLTRVRDTGTQTALSVEERQSNVRGAFRAREDVRKTLRYVLVDDVMTTGATLDACAATLLAAGARRPCVLTLARA